MCNGTEIKTLTYDQDVIVLQPKRDLNCFVIHCETVSPQFDRISANTSVLKPFKGSDATYTFLKSLRKKIVITGKK